jgi:hypothetical protein
LAKPLKPSKKFVSQLSGLSIVEKAPPNGIKVSRKRMSSTLAGGIDATLTSARALNFFDSGLFASDGEAALPTQPQKHPHKSPTLKNAPKTSVVKGNFKYFLSLLPIYRSCCRTFVAFDTAKMAVILPDAIVKGLGSRGARCNKTTSEMRGPSSRISIG